MGLAGRRTTHSRTACIYMFLADPPRLLSRLLLVGLRTVALCVPVCMVHGPIAKLPALGGCFTRICLRADHQSMSCPEHWTWERATNHPSVERNPAFGSKVQSLRQPHVTLYPFRALSLAMKAVWQARAEPSGGSTPDLRGPSGTSLGLARRHRVRGAGDVGLEAKMGRRWAGAMTQGARGGRGTHSAR